LGTTAIPTASGFVLAQVWGMIQAIPVPPTVNAPAPSVFSATPKPLPANITGKGTIAVFRTIIVIAALALVVFAPKIWFVSLVLGIIGWGAAGAAGSSARAEETDKRTAVHKQAQGEYDRLVQALKGEGGPASFLSKKTELSRVRDELQDFPQKEKQEIDQLRSTAHERQKFKFLDGCFIDSATIAGVGPTRKAALRSFGIETAADVTKAKVMQVRGFGDGLTRAVLDWKASCERRFVFNPANAVSNADKDAVTAKFRSRKLLMEKALAAGPAELQKLRKQREARFASLMPQIEEAARRLAQANADLSILKK